MGAAHSVECRRDGALVGGLYGVALGGVFFGESMFSLARDASKVALVHLIARLRAGGFRLLDTQFVTGHLAQFGAREIPREDSPPAHGGARCAGALDRRAGRGGADGVKSAFSRGAKESRLETFVYRGRRCWRWPVRRRSRRLCLAAPGPRCRRGVSCRGSSAGGRGPQSRDDPLFGAMRDKLRVELRGQPVVALIDFKRQRMGMLFEPGKIFFETKLDPRVVPGFVLPADANVTRAGTDTVAGMGCTVWDLSGGGVPDRPASPRTGWCCARWGKRRDRGGWRRSPSPTRRSPPRFSPPHLTGSAGWPRGSAQPSWPGLARPSTSFGTAKRRGYPAFAGHDEGEYTDAQARDKASAEQFAPNQSGVRESRRGDGLRQRRRQRPLPALEAHRRARAVLVRLAGALGARTEPSSWAPAWSRRRSATTRRSSRRRWARWARCSRAG